MSLHSLCPHPPSGNPLDNVSLEDDSHKQQLFFKDEELLYGVLPKEGRGVVKGLYHTQERWEETSTGTNIIKGGL